MSLVDYAYSNTRIMVMKSQLLGEKELESLARAKSPEDFIASLKQTQYGESLSSLDRTDVHEVEKHLRLDLLRTVRKLLKISPEKCSPFIVALIKRYEFDMVKFVLNSRAGGVPAEEIASGLPVGGSEDFFDRDVEELLSNIGTMPAEEVVPSLIRCYPGLDEFLRGSTDTLSILLALDKQYFSGLWDAVSTLRGGEKKTAKMIFALEADAANIMVLLRAVSCGCDVSRFIIPGEGHLLPPTEELVADDVAGVIKKISATPYVGMLGEAFSMYSKTGSFLPVELALKRYVVGQYQSFMAKNPFRFGFVLGYLKRKELEVENLRAMYIGIEEGLPFEKLSDLLLM